MLADLRQTQSTVWQLSNFQPALPSQKESLLMTLEWSPEISQRPPPVPSAPFLQPLALVLAGGVCSLGCTQPAKWSPVMPVLPRNPRSKGEKGKERTEERSWEIFRLEVEDRKKKTWHTLMKNSSEETVKCCFLKLFRHMIDNFKRTLKTLSTLEKSSSDFLFVLRSCGVDINFNFEIGT